MKHANTYFIPGKGWVGFDEEKARKCFLKAYIDDSGIVRWRSNDRVPFPDMTYDFYCINMIDVDVWTNSNLKRQEEDILWLEEYRLRMKDHVHSAEELFEMEAAFGKGTTVVNVITGKKVKL